MSNDINFSALWNQQAAAAPDMTALIGKARALQNKTRTKLIGLSLLLLATAAFIIGIGIYYHPTLITTPVGIGLVVLAIAISVVHNTGSIQLLSQKNTDGSNTQYLQQLIRLKQKQEFMHRVIMSIYFVLLSLGIFLYMIEYSCRMETAFAILAYALTAAWIAFNWFFLRPRTIKKQQTTLNQLIAQFERIQQQFSESKE